MTNILSIGEISRLLQTIGQESRLQILLAIGEGETCVCHLESALGWRQAYLSQHLMALRKAGILLARRDGRFIHYRLKKPGLLEVIRRAAELEGDSLPELSPSESCNCPNCKKKDCHA